MCCKQNWLDTLPIVLLEMRNIPNEDGVSPAIAVTGTRFLLPQPVISSTSEQSFSSSDIQTLAKEMNLLSSTLLSEGRLHTTTKPFIPNDLKNCTHVWIKSIELDVHWKHHIMALSKSYTEMKNISEFNYLQDIQKIYPSIALNLYTLKIFL